MQITMAGGSTVREVDWGRMLVSFTANEADYSAYPRPPFEFDAASCVESSV